MKKRGAMGIFTLILLVAMIIVSAIVAAVLLTTTDSVRQKTELAGKRTRGEISTHISAYEVIGKDGRDHTIDKLEYVIKLTSGSEPVDLSSSLLEIDRANETAMLSFRDNGTIEHSNSGYNTWYPEEIGRLLNWHDNVAVGGTGFPFVGNTETDINLDLDEDGINDSMMVCDNNGPCPVQYDGTHVMFNLSSAGWVFVELTTPSGSQADVSGATANPVDLLVDNAPIGGYGLLYISGTTEQNYALRSWTTLTVDVYLNPFVLEDDLDEDGVDDTIAINRTHAIVMLSDAGNAPIQFNTPLSGAVSLDVDEDIIVNGTTYGRLRILGNTTQADVIDETVTMTVTPENEGKGFFVAEFLNRGAHSQANLLARGDTVRLHFETPGEILEDEHVRISLLTSKGGPTVTEFNIPTVINTEVMTLWP